MSSRSSTEPTTTPIPPGRVKQAASGASAWKTDALRGLSAASSSFGYTLPPLRRIDRRPSFVMTGICALTVGLILFFATPSQSEHGAAFHLSGVPAGPLRALLTSELVNHTQRSIASDDGEFDTQAHCMVETPAPEWMKLTILGSLSKGSDGIKSLANSYVDRARDIIATFAEQPSQSERLLSQRADAMRIRREQLDLQLKAAAAGLPELDPSELREELQARWEGVRSRFSETREQLVVARESYQTLRSDAEPTFGIVGTLERQNALSADDALQQDLKELAVRLAEVKRLLLDVWQESAGWLERLQTQSADLVALTAPTGTDGQDRKLSRLLSSFQIEAEQYHALATAFSGKWTKEFTSLRRLPIDALQRELLDSHERTKSQMNDFLFHAGRRLTAMRMLVTSPMTSDENGPGVLAAHSEMKRAFHKVQQAHHQFEFAASNIAPSNNFRLDSGLQSARGLHRRSQERIRGIEDQLRVQAAERARHRRTINLEQTEQSIVLMRERADESVDELLSIQSELTLTAAQSQDFLRAVLRRDMTKSQIDRTDGDLTELQTEIDRLAAQRRTIEERAKVELVSYHSGAARQSLKGRLSLGGLGAVLTLLTVGFAQWWVCRRRA